MYEEICLSAHLASRFPRRRPHPVREGCSSGGATITARALGVLHTATYDAWAAYDPTAKVTRPDGPAQQANGNTLANKQEAISYAAYRVLNDLFPAGTFPSVGAYKTPDVLLTSLGYSTATTTPALPTA